MKPVQGETWPDKVLLKSLYTNSVDNLLLLTGWKQDSQQPIDFNSHLGPLV